MTIWLTGLPSAGKTTIAKCLGSRLTELGVPVEILDGDEIRPVLSPGLGYNRADRDENVRRVAYVASLLVRNGVTVICALVSPYREARDLARAMLAGCFVEVYVDAPLHVCIERDVKGLYRSEGVPTAFLTGVSDSYEPPVRAEVTVRTDQCDVEQAVDLILQSIIPVVRA